MGSDHRRKYWFQKRYAPEVCAFIERTAALKRAVHAQRIHQLAIGALERRRCLAFTYGGYDRLVEVHAVGATREGALLLSGLQLVASRAWAAGLAPIHRR